MTCLSGRSDGDRTLTWDSQWLRLLDVRTVQWSAPVLCILIATFLVILAFLSDPSAIHSSLDF